MTRRANVKGVMARHPVKAPHTCSETEFERLMFKQAQGLALTSDEWAALGYRMCETPRGAPICGCGAYRLEWEGAGQGGARR